jgi:hypothetical protein
VGGEDEGKIPRKKGATMGKKTVRESVGERARIGDLKENKRERRKGRKKYAEESCRFVERS